MDSKVTFRLIMVAGLAMAFFSYIVLPIYQGDIRFMTVLSGSMSPFMHAGDVVLVSRIDPEEVRIGDTITFENGKSYISHKVIAFEDGKFQTRGIANEEVDPELRSADSVVGRVDFVVPKLGFLGRFAHSRWGFVFLVVVPGLLLIAQEVKKIRRILKEEGL